MTTELTREIGHILPQTWPPSLVVLDFSAILSSVTAKILKGHIGDSEKASLLLPAPGAGPAACCEPGSCSILSKISPPLSTVGWLMWWPPPHPRPSALNRLKKVQLKVGQSHISRGGSYGGH